MKPLYGHTSPETAYMVNDYPYGGQRCRIRFWLESNEKKGFRFCSQTEHPRRLVWNAPKKSTYVLLAGCMYLTEAGDWSRGNPAPVGHVEWDGITEYSKAEDVRKFITKYPEADRSKLVPWCMQKTVYWRARADGRIKWSVNNVVKEDSESEIEENRKEAGLWSECTALMKGSVG